MVVNIIEYRSADRTGKRYVRPRILGCVALGAGMPVLSGSVLERDAEIVSEGQDVRDYDFGEGDFFADWE